jgi:uncharacterized protein (UPF0210 family)
MDSDLLNKFTYSTERYKLSVLQCPSNELNDIIRQVQNLNIKIIDIGKEVSQFISDKLNSKYLNLEVVEFLGSLIDNNKSKINDSSNNIVAIYNLGILLEPDLNLSIESILRGVSKSTSIIIIWENQIEDFNILNWSTQKANYFIDLSDISLLNL